MLSEAEMNREFEIIWDSAIAERLTRGELNEEIDIQGAFRAELENRGLIGEENRLWRCYHDLMLLKEQDRRRYDLVLMKYKHERDPSVQYPAIVAEFKIWPAARRALEDDLRKLEVLCDTSNGSYPSDPDGKNGFFQRPYACHMLCIADIGPRRAKLWQEWLDHLRSDPKYRVVLRVYDSALRKELIELKTMFSQWGRYQGDRGALSWLEPTRDLWQLRVTLLRAGSANDPA